MDYNVAIQRTNDEQMLLNLVRLRYRDTPQFLNVSSVSTQFSFTVSGGAGATYASQSPDVYRPTVGIAYTEKPTVTYAPLQGEKFVTQLLSPVDLETLLLLYHSGWSISRILRVVVQGINGVMNAPGASGPTPSAVPEFETFMHVTKLLRKLQVDNQLALGAEKDGEATKFVISLGVESETSRELKELLKLDAKASKFDLKIGVGAGKPGEIILSTRSVLAVMFYLSQSVEPPESDIEAGRVTVTRSADGTPFDWSKVLGQTIRIRTEGGTGAGAAVSVNYRGSTFFIDDADLPSKSTFSLLTQLFALQSGDQKGAVPTLTIPLGN